MLPAFITRSRLRSHAACALVLITVIAAPFSIAADNTYAYIGNYSNSRIDRVLHADDAAGRAEQALLLELQHLVGEALPLLADAVRLRHADIVEVDLRGVG